MGSNESGAVDKWTIGCGIFVALLPFALIAAAVAAVARGLGMPDRQAQDLGGQVGAITLLVAAVPVVWLIIRSRDPRGWAARQGERRESVRASIESAVAAGLTPPEHVIGVGLFQAPAMLSAPGGAVVGIVATTDAVRVVGASQDPSVGEALPLWTVPLSRVTRCERVGNTLVLAGPDHQARSFGPWLAGGEECGRVAEWVNEAIIAQDRRRIAPASVAGELRGLSELAQEGLLSPEEWERAKQLYLGKPPTAQATAVEQLRQLHALYRGGVLSEAEFNDKKWDILARMR